MSKVRFKQFNTNGIVKSQRVYFDGSQWRYFGYEDYASDETIQSTGSTTYGNILQLTTGPVEAGQYELFFQVSSRYTQNRWSSDFRILVNGVEVVEFRQSTKDTSSNQRIQNSGVKIVNLNAGVNTIVMQAKNENGGNTTTIYSPRFFIRDTANSAQQNNSFTCKTKIKQLESLGATQNQTVRWNGSEFVNIGYYQQVLDNTTSTTSSSTYQNKLTLTTPANLPQGDYLLRWHFTWYRQNTGNDGGFQVIQNFNFPIQTWEMEPKDPSTDQTNINSGFYLARNLSGSNTYTIRFRELNGNTVGIKYAFINLEQVLTFS